MGKTDKSKKKSDKKKESSAKQKEKDAAQTRENNDVKDVLQLFSKLEEMVVDGDPRVREALSQKPGK